MSQRAFAVLTTLFVRFMLHSPVPLWGSDVWCTILWESMRTVNYLARLRVSLMGFSSLRLKLEGNSQWAERTMCARMRKAWRQLAARRLCEYRY